MIRSTRAIWSSVAAAAGLLLSFSASASALHAFCFTPTAACTDNGTVTPTTNPSPNFGFWYSSGPASGNFYVDILVPNNDSLPSSFTVTDQAQGKTVSASEFALESWTSGSLASYLGISASPTNPIASWLPTTQGNDPGATGYYVFQANIGSNIMLAGAAGSGPDLNAGTLDLGTVVVGFFDVCNGDNCSNKWVATPSSSALFEGTSTVPEPGTLALFGAGLLGFAVFAGLRRRAARRG